MMVLSRTYKSLLPLPYFLFSILDYYHRGKVCAKKIFSPSTNSSLRVEVDRNHGGTGIIEPSYMEMDGYCLLCNYM
jgi:hypothetical protein